MLYLVLYYCTAGLAGYTAWRELCGLGRAETWQQLSPAIPPEIVQRLQLLYTDIRDIDLFVGGVRKTCMYDFRHRL